MAPWIKCSVCGRRYKDSDNHFESDYHKLFLEKARIESEGMAPVGRKTGVLKLFQHIGGCDPVWVATNMYEYPNGIGKREGKVIKREPWVPVWVYCIYRLCGAYRAIPQWEPRMGALIKMIHEDQHLALAVEGANRMGEDFLWELLTDWLELTPEELAGISPVYFGVSVPYAKKTIAQISTERFLKTHDLTHARVNGAFKKHMGTLKTRTDTLSKTLYSILSEQSDGGIEEEPPL